MSMPVIQLRTGMRADILNLGRFIASAPPPPPRRTHVGAILVGLLFVWLVQRAPRGLVIFALALEICVPAAVGAMGLTQGLVGPVIPLLVVVALTVFLFALWRPQVRAAAWDQGASGSRH